jgi:tetratricopeptide (TPR) repeat protein
MTGRADDELGRLTADAMAHHKAGRLAEAETAFRAALVVAPSQPILAHNLGVVVAAQQRHGEAVRLFEQAIAAEPHYASAHYNRGAALSALGQTKDAIRAFRAACEIEPEHYEAHRALAFLWLAEGERGRALDHFTRTYELRRGDDRSGMAAHSLTAATRSKLLHDADQFRYLSRIRRDGQRFETLARIYDEVASGVPEQAVKLSDAQLDRLGEDYNTAIHVRAAPDIAAGAVSERVDRAALVRQFREGGSGAVFFDDLLTPEALASLRRYLLESTIWHDFNHIGGFVASYLEDGLACPLILQIADEVRARFPELMGAHPLTQGWAFKGLKASSAVDVHADDAAVSVNFWVTPSEANRDPGRGGLAVCRVPPPAGWKIHGYEADQGQIVTFLEQNAGDMLLVPYGDNRAVLFESRLFHHSDSPEFAEGYEHHRINVTLLFGRHREG